MLVLESYGLQLIFFKSGKFRVMGIIYPPKRTNVKRLLKLNFSNLLHANIWKRMSPSLLTWQTSTVAFKVNSSINLRKFCDFLLHKYTKKRNNIAYCELESFPALAFKLWSPLHINVFHSGCV